jgi:hypothetical protein
MLGVFLINVYLGLYDTNLSSFNPAHYDANWVIAIVTLIAAVLLLWKPASSSLVLLGGVIWPVVYVLALAGDAYTKLCLGTSASNCWPSKTAAFNYLILNNSNIAGGYGWKLAPVVPIALVLLAVVFVVSIADVVSLRRHGTAASSPPQPAPSVTPTQ